jgi:hypothetical protein
VFQVATEAIETPADHRIESSTPGVNTKLVEGGTPTLRPAHAAVDVLDRLPAARRSVRAEFGQLILGLLVERTYAGIDGSLHRPAPMVRVVASALPADRF